MDYQQVKPIDYQYWVLAFVFWGTQRWESGVKKGHEFVVTPQHGRRFSFAYCCISKWVNSSTVPYERCGNTTCSRLTVDKSGCFAVGIVQTDSSLNYMLTYMHICIHRVRQ